MKAWIQNRVSLFMLTEYAKVVEMAKMVESGSELSKKEKESDGKKRKADTFGGNSGVGSFQNRFSGR